MLALLNKKRNFSIPILIFTFFFLIYISSSGAHPDPYDGISFFLIGENFALNGTPTMNINSPSADTLGFDISEYIRIKASLEAWPQWKIHAPEMRFGDYRDIYLESVNRESYFSNAYVVLPFLIAPLYLVATTLNFSPITFVSLLFNPIILSITCVVIFLFGKKLYGSEKIGFTLALIFGVTSFMWPYITTLFANIIGILFLVSSIYLIIREKTNPTLFNSFFAGLFIGLSFLSNLQFATVFPAVAIYGLIKFRKNKRSLLLFLIAISITLLIQAELNMIRTGSPFEIGYMEFEQPGLIEENNFFSMFEGMYGFLLSPGNSIFLYFPIAILYPIGLYYLSKYDKSLAILFIVITLIIYLLIATETSWNKNPYWGAHRYLLPIIPLITLSVGSLIVKFSNFPRWRWGIVLLSVGGFFSNLLGNLVWVQYAFSYGWGPEGIWKIEDKSSIFTWNPFHSPIVQSIKVLLTDWTSTIVNPVDGYMKVGLYGCSYDVFFYCKFGIFPIILLGIGISIVGYILLKILTTPNEQHTKPNF
jgi:hypothetical protein